MALNSASVTCLLPVRNGEQFIENTIRTISDSTLNRDEILVINDGSEDFTKQILTGLANDVPNLRVIDTSGIGLVHALNLGIKEAQNSIIARFDVDDIYDRNRIQLQRETFERSNAPVAVFSDYEFIDNKESYLGTIYTAVFPAETSLSLITSSRTPHPGVMYLREAVIAAGGYRQEDFPAEDLSLWLRLSRTGDLQTLPMTFLKYRIWPGSITQQSKSKSADSRDRLLQNIGLNQRDIDLVISRIETRLLDYSETSHSSSRLLLTLRDLIKAKEQNLVNPKQEKVISFLKRRLLSSPATYLSLLRFGNEKRKRQQARKAQD